MQEYFNIKTLIKNADRYTIPSEIPTAEGYKKNIYVEDRPPLKDTDVVRVFHGFRDLEDAVAACKYGLSGKSRVGRVYSYESDNNPTGLFVTTEPRIAAEFGNYIIEFNARVSELEAPVWPSGAYTVQGQMAQYFGRSKSKREEARLRDRELAKKQNIPSFSESDRPELASRLYSYGEKQALFIGHLNPNRIIRVWTRGGYKEGSQNISRMEFLKSHKNLEIKGRSEAAMASQRLFKVDEEFSPDAFIERLRQKYLNRNTYEEIKDRIVRVFGRLKFHDMKFELNRYVWPKQMPAAIRWLSQEYKKSEKQKTQQKLHEQLSEQ
jgi:hypothetical protein